jgi:endoglucanase
MKPKALISRPPTASLIAAAAILFAAGCKTSPDDCCDTPAETMTPATNSAASATPRAASTPAAAVPAVSFAPIRIKAGVSTSITNAEGQVWLSDQGFDGGDVVERADITIANTKNPEIYKSERYSMSSFSRPIPNGKYIVKLHFAETFEGITGPGERVFTFKVEDKEFKNFDVFAKAGGSLRAYVETVNVEVTDGKLDISFTAQVENPEINGIEILPAQ